jgi:single-stranded DNA-binding protein
LQLPSTPPLQSSQQLCAVTLLGNLVAKPDIRYKANPVIAITEVIVATTSKWLDKASNKYKEWTSYHHVKVEGELVEQSLLHANKGDIVLVHGYLSNVKPTSTKDKHSSNEHPSIVHANFIQKFNKGYTQSINQINSSATLASTPQLMLTEHNKHFTQADVIIKQHIFNREKQSWQITSVERAIHIWGKQAQYLAENGVINDEIVIEGKLSYATNTTKSQFIDVIKLHLFKN